MSLGGALSARTLILAPTGRDAAIASAILGEADIASLICPDLAGLIEEMSKGAGLAVVAEEALRDKDLRSLVLWLSDQPSWSDFPFVVLTQRGGSIERNPLARRLLDTLGNVSFLERPFHPTTLVSAVGTALRGRRRQYEARARMEQIERAEALLERRVTERTAELEAANRQLAAQITERERIEDDLRQAQRLEAIGQLTAGVAHDFNNLLTVLIGNVEQMRKQISDPAIVRRLSMMSLAAERGAKLTAQMLAFSRRQTLEACAVDLNDTVRRMRDMLQNTIGGNVRIEEPDLADDLWPALIDPTQIELVILNLAINARDAMPNGGQLTIRTANVVMGPPERPQDPPEGDYVRVSVEDNGTGIPPDVLTRVFEPFFTTKEVGKGSGLGLSQTFGLAKQSGGGVDIDTELGRGTSIHVYLPRTAAAPVEDLVTQGAEPMAHADNVNVLVVDDDDAVREVTAGLLRDLGYHVFEAGSGGAALETFETVDGIDAVVLDFAMPGMNGAEIARALRLRRPQLAILFATGYADAEALIDVGPELIVKKPLMRRDLAAKLSRSLAAGL